MARAIRLGIEAGRLARRAGRIPRRALRRGLDAREGRPRVRLPQRPARRRTGDDERHDAVASAAPADQHLARADRLARAARPAGSRSAAAPSEPIQSNDADAREQRRAAAPAQRGLPPDHEQRDAGARRARTAGRAPQRRPEREQREVRRPQRGHRPRGADGSRGRQRSADRRADDRPDAERDASARRTRRPARSASWAIVGPSVQERREREHQRERRAGDRHRRPRARAHARASRLAQLARSGVRSARARRARAGARAAAAAETKNVSASNANAEPAPSPSTSAVASAGPTNSADVVDDEGGRVGLLQLVVRHGLRDQAGGGRVEERLGGAEQRLDHHDRPDRRRPEEDQRGQQPVQRSRARCRWRPSRGGAQAVGPDAAEQQKSDERERVGGEHEADVGRRADSVTYSASATNTMPVAERASTLAASHSSRNSRCGRTRASPCMMAAVTVDELFDGWERAWSGRDPAAVRAAVRRGRPLRGSADAGAARRRRGDRRARRAAVERVPRRAHAAHGRAADQRALRRRAGASCSPPTAASSRASPRPTAS